MDGWSYEIPCSRPLVRGTFLSRYNRFIVYALVDGKTVKCYMPNPGRLWELLFVGSELLLSRSWGMDEGRLEFVVMAVRSGGVFVPLHTHVSNDVASFLVDNGLAPGYERFETAGREVSVKALSHDGTSRFDLVLRDRENGARVWGEVKTSTLFWGEGAFFPDAPSQRASRHLCHLKDLVLDGQKAVVFVLAQSLDVRWFLPDFHTDPVFARSVLDVKDLVDFRALALGWDEDLRLAARPVGIPVRFDLLEGLDLDGGILLVLLEVEGRYCLGVEAVSDLDLRMRQYGRARKKPLCRLEELRSLGRLVAAIPVRNATGLFDFCVGSLGSLECLKRFEDEDFIFEAFCDLRHDKGFVDWLLDFRFRICLGL